MASLLLCSIASTLYRFYGTIASTALLFLRFYCFYDSIASMALLIGIPVVQEKSLRKSGMIKHTRYVYVPNRETRMRYDYDDGR